MDQDEEIIAVKKQMLRGKNRITETYQKSDMQA